MAEINKVVVHDLKGNLIKGSTQDFYVERPTFRVVLPNGVDTVPIKLANLKAVFFVKELDGNQLRARAKQFSETDTNRPNNRPVAVVFKDGELLVGYANSYSNERLGFFVLPASSEDNTLRVFVIRNATKAIKLGPAAEELVRKVAAERDGKSDAA